MEGIPSEDIHAAPLERRVPEPEARNLYIPLAMGAPTLLTTIVVTTPVLQIRAADSTTSLHTSSHTSSRSSSGKSSATKTSSHFTSSATASSTKSAAPKQTCGPDDNTGFCQKPTTPSSQKLPIILGVVIPLVGICIALLVLHRRHVRKLRREDQHDPHADLDFGLGSHGRPKRGGAAGNFDMEEKPGRARQVSLDLSSPYLLPPGLHDSKESLHSLSRSLKNEEDPYRPVSRATNDGGSIHNGFGGGRVKGSSVHTGWSGTSSRMQKDQDVGPLGDNNQMGGGFLPPPRTGSLPQANRANGATSPSPSSLKPIEPAYFPDMPPVNGQRNSPPRLALEPKDTRESYMGQDTAALRASNNYLGAFIAGGTRTETPEPKHDVEHPQSPFNDPLPSAPGSPESIKKALPANTLPANPRPARSESLSQNSQPTGPLPSIPQTTQNQPWFEDEYVEDNNFIVTPPSPKTEAVIKRANRYSMDVPPEEFAAAGLGAPGFDAKRLSMGFRPLPPTLAVESDDPEVRANRIRSFYKEYFDESKPAPAGQYYEDYDNGAYYDPQQNNFDMPFTEPVTRRAMTPPPGAGRYMGQRGPPPPRAFHGSLAQNNFRGPPPPRGFHGSMGGESFQGGPGPRPDSSASNPRYARRGGPGSRAGTPSGKPRPPPEDLRTIPTPAMLKDDNFAIINAADFAPPPSYKDRREGRSQSPMGERRPYSPALPAYKPIVSAFDELAPIPSPHLLRKSGTFTSLDFAPPRRIRTEDDSMSDSGSIRSNRSGISQRSHWAVRNGANRVSRLPQDQIFTKDQMQDVLKPTWGQRGAADF